MAVFYKTSTILIDLERLMAVFLEEQSDGRWALRGKFHDGHDEWLLLGTKAECEAELTLIADQVIEKP